MHEQLAQERELGSDWVGWWSDGEGGLQGTPTSILDPRSTAGREFLAACGPVELRRARPETITFHGHPLRQLHPLQRRRIGTALISLPLSPISFNSWFADVFVQNIRLLKNLETTSTG